MGILFFIITGICGYFQLLYAHHSTPWAVQSSRGYIYLQQDNQPTPPPPPNALQTHFKEVYVQSSLFYTALAAVHLARPVKLGIKQKFDQARGLCKL